MCTDTAMHSVSQTSEQNVNSCMFFTWWIKRHQWLESALLRRTCRQKYCICGRLQVTAQKNVCFTPRELVLGCASPCTQKCGVRVKKSMQVQLGFELLLKACIRIRPITYLSFLWKPSRTFLTLWAQDEEGMTQATGHSWRLTLLTFRALFFARTISGVSVMLVNLSWTAGWRYFLSLRISPALFACSTPTESMGTHPMPLSHSRSAL